MTAMIDLLPRLVPLELAQGFTMPDGIVFRIRLGNNVVHPFLKERAWPLQLEIGTNPPVTVSWIMGDAGDVTVQYVEECIFRHLQSVLSPTSDPDSSVQRMEIATEPQ